MRGVQLGQIIKPILLGILLVVLLITEDGFAAKKVTKEVPKTPLESLMNFHRLTCEVVPHKRNRTKVLWSVSKMHLRKKRAKDKKGDFEIAVHHPHRETRNYFFPSDCKVRNRVGQTELYCIPSVVGRTLKYQASAYMNLENMEYKVDSQTGELKATGIALYQDPKVGKRGARCQLTIPKVAKTKDQCMMDIIEHCDKNTSIENQYACLYNRLSQGQHLLTECKQALTGFQDTSKFSLREYSSVNESHPL